MNVIFGSSGFAKEIDFFLHDNTEGIKIDYYVSLDDVGQKILGVEVISEADFVRFAGENGDQEIKAYIGVGSPNIRRKIFERFKLLPTICFPNLLHKSVVFDGRSAANKLQTGNIFCPGGVLTTNIQIGTQNHFNYNVTIGHDSTIGDFNTFSPGVHVSGNVRVGNKVFVGAGAVILERLEIVDNVVIGAGAVITKSLMEPGTYVGVPAKKIK